MLILLFSFSYMIMQVQLKVQYRVKLRRLESRFYFAHKPIFFFTWLVFLRVYQPISMHFYFTYSIEMFVFFTYIFYKTFVLFNRPYREKFPMFALFTLFFVCLDWAKYNPVEHLERFPKAHYYLPLCCDRYAPDKHTVTIDDLESDPVTAFFSSFSDISFF